MRRDHPRHARTLTAISPIAVQVGVAQSRFTVVPSLSIGAVYDDNLLAEVESDAGKMLQVRPSLRALTSRPADPGQFYYSQDMLRFEFLVAASGERRRPRSSTPNQKHAA